MDSSNFTWFDHRLADWRQEQVLMRLHEGDRLIDLGCGAEPVLLRKASPIIHWGIGFDYDAHNLRERNFFVRRATITDTFPLPNHTATVVSMTAVIEHFSLNDALNIFKACQRVLLPGGRVILTTPSPFGKYPLETIARLTPLIAKGEVFDHRHYYSKRDLAYLAAQASLHLIHYSTFEWGGNSAAVLVNQ